MPGWRLALNLLPLSVLTALAMAPSLALAAEPAVATPLGTALAEQGDWQLYATVGVPDLELGALTGLSSAADVATRISLGYGESLRLGGFAAKVSSGVRLRLGQTGGVTWLLRAEPGLAVHAAAEDYPPFHRRTQTGASTFALDTGTPALQGGAWLGKLVHVSVGVAAPLRLVFAPAPLLEVPLQLQTSAQIKLSGPFWLLLGADIGAHLYGPGAGEPASALLSRVRAGLVF